MSITAAVSVFISYCPVLLPCLARLYKVPESLYLNPYVGEGKVGGKLSKENVAELCDMQTDGGKVQLNGQNFVG